MPWCEDCSKFYNPPDLGESNACPSCGKVLTIARRKVPWHFKLMLLALAIYMVYRIYWLIEWLPKHV